MDTLTFWSGYLACALVLGASQMLHQVAERNLRIRAARRGRVSRLA